MKKVLRGGVALVLLVAIAFGVYAARLVRSIGTPEFKTRMAREASAFVGARVQFASVDVSLLRGIRVGGIRIQNPPGFEGDLGSAEGAKLAYDLLPLLLGRIQVDELSLRRPVITLVTDASGSFNYKHLAVVAPGEGKTASAASTSTATSLLRLVVSKLGVNEGRFAVVDQKKAAVLRLEGASLDSTLALEAGALTGTGKAAVDSVVLANALFLRGVRAPLKITKKRLSLAPLQAKVAGGAVTGEINVDFEPAMRYALRLDTRGANVATLIREAGGAGTLSGALDARARIEGSGGVATIKGAGNVEVKDCRWPQASLLNALADLLQVPELRDPRFDECRVEFTLGGGQARTPVVSLKGPALQLAGQGAVNLLTSVIDYDLTLALSPTLFAKVPAAMRAGFKTRPDGFGVIPFKVTGTTAAPRTDLATRVGKAAAIEAAKGQLGRLFGPKKKPPQ